MRISFGIVAAFVLFFAFTIVYSLVSPAWDTWYQMILQEGSVRVLHPTQFLNFVWELLPLAVLCLTILWLIVAGMGEAANPGKLLLGIIVLVTGLCAMMLLYVTCDPIISDWAALAGAYAGIFAPVIGLIQTVWYNYSIPMVFAILIWCAALAISTEAETAWV